MCLNTDRDHDLKGIITSVVFLGLQSTHSLLDRTRSVVTFSSNPHNNPLKHIFTIFLLGQGNGLGEVTKLAQSNTAGRSDSWIKISFLLHHSACHWGFLSLWLQHFYHFCWLFFLYPSPTHWGSSLDSHFAIYTLRLSHAPPMLSITMYTWMVSKSKYLRSLFSPQTCQSPGSLAGILTHV